MIRLAADDPAAAAEQIGRLRWRTQLTQEERSVVWGMIGKRAAMQLSNEAPGYFANAKDQYLQPEHLEWKVRAALRAGQWSQVLDATAAMDESQRLDPTWIYWRARALMSAGRPAADRALATTMLESIASERGFYEQLALEELGRKITVPPAPPALSDKEKDAASSNPALVRSAYADRPGSAQRRQPRMELRGAPARARRHGRPQPAGGRRPGLRTRRLDELHQHQRTHARVHGLRPALSRCPCTTQCWRARARSDWIRPTCMG